MAQQTSSSDANPTGREQSISPAFDEFDPDPHHHQHQHHEQLRDVDDDKLIGRTQREWAQLMDEYERQMRVDKQEQLMMLGVAPETSTDNLNNLNNLNNNNNSSTSTSNGTNKRNSSSLGEQSASSLSSSDLSDSTLVAEEEEEQELEEDEDEECLQQVGMSLRAPAPADKRPTTSSSKIARFAGLADENNNNNSNNNATQPELASRENREFEVSECLEQLVESVAVATNSSAQANEAAHLPYKTFKLNEVVLAQTTQSSGSESDDEPATLTATTTSDHHDHHEIHEVKLVGEFCLERNEFELNKQHVINLAQDYLAIQNASTHQVLRVDLSTWTPDEPETGPQIKWRNQRNERGAISARDVIDCLANEKFIIWILERDNQLPLKPTVGDELDLDDIALALNEPIASQPPQDVCVIIWHCPQPADTRRIETFWRQRAASARSAATDRSVAQTTSGLINDDGDATAKHIEVPPRIDQAPDSSSTATNGLFVLQPQPQLQIETDVVGVEARETADSRRDSDDEGEGFELRAKSVQRAASTTNLCQANSSGQVKLANYYRSMASRVMSNSSTKLKSIKDEMSRLNGSRQSLVKSATRRLSMALSQPPAAACQGEEVTLPSQTNPPVVRPRTSVLRVADTRTKQPTRTQATSQRDENLREVQPEASEAGLNQLAEIRRPKSILKKPSSSKRANETDDNSFQVGGRRTSGDETNSQSETQAERRRQRGFKQQQHRVSSYDLPRTRLEPDRQEMAVATTTSDENKENSLARLRAGSTGSAASRSRQRRPALLLLKQENAFDLPPPPAPVQGTLETHDDKQTSQQGDEAVTLARVRVSASHLKRSASMKVAHKQLDGDLETGRHGGDQRKQPSGKQQVVVACLAATKKSEFDPRSLRKLPMETAQALRALSDQRRGPPQVPSSSVALHRRSVASVEMLRGDHLGESDDKFEPVDGAPSATTRLASSKSGTLSMLRQSFNQKSLSSMLKFSGRASFRVKTIDEVAPGSSSSLGNKSATTRLEVGEHEAKSSRRQTRSDLALCDNPSTRRGDVVEQTSTTTAATATAKSASKLDKAQALRVAEANLLAAKQLKQQAQKLREQQRRAEQQQQQASLDSVALLFYQQQIQKQQQQQQQQQQLIYQQQIAQFASQQQHQHQQQQLLFDPLNVHLRHQQQQQQQLFAIQRQQQQQQQLAYLSSAAHFMAAAQSAPPSQIAGQSSHMHPLAQLSSTQSMAAQAALMATALAPPPPPPASSSALAPQLAQLVGGPAPAINQSMISGHHQHRMIAAGHTNNNKLIYQQQQQHQQQQYIPMSVNHHSSFNIVYTAAAAPPPPPPPQPAHQHHQPTSSAYYTDHHHHQHHQQVSTHQVQALNMTQIHQQQQQQAIDDSSAMVIRSKHSSLGASVRKTFRNILNKSAHISQNTTEQQPQQQILNNHPRPVLSNQKPLKSALKQTKTTTTTNGGLNDRTDMLMLNSEGSDGDASSSSSSSSDSCTAVDCSRPAPRKSALKKSIQYEQEQLLSKKHQQTSTSSSSDSSLASLLTASSCSSSLLGSQQTVKRKSATLTRNDLERLRKEFIRNDQTSQGGPGDPRRTQVGPMQRAANARRSIMDAPERRKNVTFSSKLTTSIL